MIQAFANFMDNGSQSATVIFYQGGVYFYLGELEWSRVQEKP